MLTIYTRHAGDCDHRDDMNWRRCRCPKWIRGVLPNGRNLRTAAKTRSWEQAEKYARKWKRKRSVAARRRTQPGAINDSRCRAVVSR